MRNCGKTARVAMAAVAIWLSLSANASAQTVRERYEAAVEREEKVRALLTTTGGATADVMAQVTQAATAFEILVRRFPTSGYADNALFQAASLVESAYEKFN